MLGPPSGAGRPGPGDAVDDGDPGGQGHVLEGVAAVGDDHIGARPGQQPGQADHHPGVQAGGRRHPAGSPERLVHLDVGRPVEQAHQTLPAGRPSELVDEGAGEELGPPAERRRDHVDHPGARSPGAGDGRPALGEFRVGAHDEAHSPRIGVAPGRSGGISSTFHHGVADPSHRVHWSAARLSGWLQHRRRGIARTDGTGRSGATGGAGPPGLRQIARPAFAALPAPARRAPDAFGRYAPWEDGFDFTAPPPGPGEVTGPPDFVGIGAQKSGTTWWYELIAAHPGVSSRADIHKERHYFTRYATRPFGPDDVAGYHRWFPRPPGRITGEWTPDYLHLAWVPALLAEAAPEARLLVLLRDPVERFRSGLDHHRRGGHRLSAQAYSDAVDRGFYDAALARWSGHFAADRVLVLQYEQCVADPRRQLERTYRFLGLDPFTPAGIDRRVSAAPRPTPVEPDVRRRLAEVYAPDVAALAGRLPDLDLGLWPNFSDRADG